MKGKANIKLFESALSIASRAASTRTTLPILYNVLLEAKNQRLHFSCTDTELGISLSIPCDIETDGKSCVNAVQLHSLVSTMSGKDIEFETMENGELVIRCQGYKTKLKSVPASDFPLVMDTELLSGKSIKTNASVFSCIPKKVCFCTAPDRVRPELSGIEISADENKLVFCGADGYRLSVASIDVQNDIDNFKSVIVPKIFINEVGKIFDEGFEIFTSYGKVIAYDGNLYISVSVLNFPYPRIKSFSPHNNKCSFDVETEAFLAGVKHIGVIARDSYDRLLIEIEADGISLYTSSQESGESKIKIPAKIEGEIGKRTTLSYVYLSEFLSSISGATTVKLYFSLIDGSGIDAPMVKFEEVGYCHVIVPFINK